MSRNTIPPWSMPGRPIPELSSPASLPLEQALPSVRRSPIIGLGAGAAGVGIGVTVPSSSITTPGSSTTIAIARAASPIAPAPCLTPIGLVMAATGGPQIAPATIALAAIARAETIDPALIIGPGRIIALAATIAPVPAIVLLLVCPGMVRPRTTGRITLPTDQLPFHDPQRPPVPHQQLRRLVLLRPRVPLPTAILMPDSLNPTKVLPLPRRAPLDLVPVLSAARPVVAPNRPRVPAVNAAWAAALQGPQLLRLVAAVRANARTRA